MAFTIANWACISSSLNQGQLTVVPFGGSSTVENAPNLFMYGSAVDAAATIVAANYFLPQYASLSVGDWIMGFGSDTSFAVQVTASSSTSVTVESTGITTSIGTANIVDGAVTGPKLNPALAVASGVVFDRTSALAAPGSFRTVVGKVDNTNATYANGSASIVGVRGEADIVGASSGFVYGVQGKIIPTGTLSGSVWVAPVFAQFDISAATVNAAQLAPVWADYGATSGTVSDATGLRMYAGTNTTAATLNSMIYLYGKTSNLLELAANGSTYISTGGATASGTIKKIAILIEGVQYYLQAATVYS